MSKEITEEVAGRVDRVLGDALRSAKAKDRDGVQKALNEARTLGVSADAFKKALTEYDQNKADFGWFRSFAQGVSLGFADEAEAFVREKIMGEDYDETLRSIRAGKAAYEGEYPMRALGAELAGGLATIATPMGLPARAVSAVGKAVLPALRGAQTVTRTPTAVGTAVRSGLTGLSEGAVYGFGTGEGGLADRTQSAMQDAALGAIGGTAFPLVTGAGQELISQIGRTPQQVSSQRIAQAIGSENIPQVAQRVEQRVAANATRPETIADISGEAAQRAVRGVRSSVPEVGQEITEFLGERGAGARGRIMSDVQGGVESSLGVRLDEVLDPEEIAAMQSRNANADYSALRSEYRDVRAKDFGSLLRAPAVRDNYAETVDEMMNRYAMGELTEDQIRSMPRTYDEAMKFLDENPDATAPFAFFETLVRKIGDDVGAAKRAGKSSRASSLSEFKSRFVDEMDNKFVGNPETGVPSYAEARKKFQDSAVVLEAFDKGLKFSRMEPKQVSKFIENASESERQAFAQAAVQSLAERFPRETGNIAGAIQTDTVMRSRIAALTGGEDSQTFKDVMDALSSESAMARSRQNIVGGSQTADKMEDVSMMGEVEGLRRRAESLGGYPSAIMERVFDEALRPFTSTDVGVRTARSLMETSPMAQQRIMQDVSRVAPAQARREFVTRLSGPTGRAIGLGSSMAQDKPVTIYTDEQMRRMGMGGLLQ